MQDTFSLCVKAKFNSGAAAGQERRHQLLASTAADMKSADEDAYNYTPNVSLPVGMGNPCLSTQYHTLQSSPVIPVSSCHQTGYIAQNDNHAASGYYLPQGLRRNGAPALESPRIEITAYSQYPEDEVEASSREEHIIKRGVNSIVTLTLPNVDVYRDPSCLSPASSISSRSCNSEASSYESGFYNYDNSPQNSPWQSPSVSPRASSLLSCPHAIGPAASPHHSPSNSPQIGAMRKYSFSGSSYHQTPCSPNQSPTPSSHGSPRVSVTDENWLANTNQYTNSAIVAAINALTTDGVVDMGEGIPIKTRKTMLDLSSSMSLKVEPGGEELGPEGDLRHEDYPSRLTLKKENYCGGFLDVPQHPYSWPKPKPYLGPSLPALDWQLPSCSGPYNLQIEVQPKSHHRAHYETEGSRGAVKALSGGHPVVQMLALSNEPPVYIQTTSFTNEQSNALFLSSCLSYRIDCAGILKLRNSDIELRKGETDIGRKNTRVRLVFRVHINQPNGRTVSLQAASNPIECCKSETLTHTIYCCSAIKRATILLPTGTNSPFNMSFLLCQIDGHHLWETEAKVDKDSVKSNTIVVEIPPYRNQRISSPVQVNFYVCNGKRKRSQYQRFTYMPANVPIIKTEPADEFDSVGSVGRHSKPYYGQTRLTSIMPVAEPDPCLVGGYPPCPPHHAAMPPLSPSSSPTLHDLSNITFNKCLPNSPTHAAPPGNVVAPIQETPCCSNLPHPTSPDHNSSLGMLHSQGSPGPLGYHHSVYANSSSSSSPVSDPSTPGGPAETPFFQAYSPSQAEASGISAQAAGSPASLLTEDTSPPSTAITIKQEPQELDQMYLDDGKSDQTCVSSEKG
uniref:Nuclear factor of activated T cells 1 n=1 Tax=Fundulus heteroclitus TaxID=8078 RepID=A0A3Q2U7M0_FUNHE